MDVIEFNYQSLPHL